MNMLGGWYASPYGTSSAPPTDQALQMLAGHPGLFGHLGAPAWAQQQLPAQPRPAPLPGGLPAWTRPIQYQMPPNWQATPGAGAGQAAPQMLTRPAVR